jgi:hypothetical protein
MPKLSETTGRKRTRRSAVDTLPEDIREQLIEARLAGTHSVTDMVEWLHNDPEHGDAYHSVSVPALTQWFQRRGYRAGP